jgi:ubiquinone/menaquinone biosynthesis C-methylase UbiE
MTDHFQQIYNNHAIRYELLISREDYAGNLFPALNQIRSLAGLDVVEMGAGTGRLTRLLAPVVKRIRAFDAAQAMLNVAALKLSDLDLKNWALQAAEHKALPVEDGSADLALAGWTFGHIPTWYPDGWKAELDRVLAEMQRVLRPDGTIIIIETMGTGFETPRPPTQNLAGYFAYLADRHGFTGTTIRTDYKFESHQEAVTLIRFFFGDDLAEKVVANQWAIVPECTGIWWRHYKT